MEASPKEKAIEIYNRFRDSENQMEANVKSKKRALISVTVTIEAFWDTHKNEIEWRYWKQVETELRKL